MTLGELQVEMTKLGYRWQQGYRLNQFKVGLFYKPIKTKRPCTCNDKDQLTVEVSDYEQLPHPETFHNLTSENRYSLTVDVTGEFPVGVAPKQNSHWAKAQVYGLTPKQFVEAHESIEAALIRAWEALT